MQQGLNRKGQRRAYTWEQFGQILIWANWPRPRIRKDLNPCRRAEAYRMTDRGAGCGKAACPVLRGAGVQPCAGRTLLALLSWESPAYSQQILYALGAGDDARNGECCRWVGRRSDAHLLRPSPHGCTTRPAIRLLAVPGRWVSVVSSRQRPASCALSASTRQEPLDLYGVVRGRRPTVLEPCHLGDHVTILNETPFSGRERGILDAARTRRTRRQEPCARWAC